MKNNILEYGYFKLSKNISKFSDCRIKVGAVICNKKPISAACNRNKTHPIHANPDDSFRSSVHAEIRAIINCDREDLRGSTIYVYRETKRGKPALARPCNHCYEFIRDAGIRKMIYTVDNYPFFKVEKV